MVCVLDSLVRVSLMAPNPINSFDLTSAANIIAKEGFQDAKPSNLWVGLLQQKVSNLKIPDNLLEGFDDDDFLILISEPSERISERISIVIRSP